MSDTEKVETKLTPLAGPLAPEYGSFVKLVSSESAIFFALPILFWGLFIGVAFAVLGFGNAFRIACSLLWAAFALMAVFSMLVNLLTQALFVRLPIDGVSLRSKFSDFLEVAHRSSGREKAAVIVLGVGKVCLIFFGACALFGGMFVLLVWLMSGVYLRAGV